MRVITSVVMVMCAAGIVYGGGVPQPTEPVKVKPPVGKACQPVPCEQQPCAPTDCTPVAVYRTIEMPAAVKVKPVPAKGQWFVGPSVGMIDGDANASWDNVRNHVHTDPSVQIRGGNRWGLGVTGAYQFPSKVQLQLNVMRYEGSDADWTWNSYDVPRSYPDNTKADVGPQTAVVVTVLVPVGGKR